MIRIRRGVRAAMVAVATLLPCVAFADDVTFNVPVQVSRLAAEVTKGRVQCHVNAGRWVAAGAREQQSQSFAWARGNGTGPEFSIANGAYSGTTTVRVSVPGPPQAWADNGYGIVLDGTPSYVCYLQLSTASSAWQPQGQFVAVGTGPSAQLSVTTTGSPAWSVPASGEPVIARGTLTVRPGSR